MKVAVVGAGIIGVTTAYELSLRGHETVVMERRSGVAAETSFANAGVLAPGYVTPWAAPGMPLKVLRHLFSRHAPVRLGGINALRQLPWIWRWWRACAPAVHVANRTAMQSLARLSSQRLQEITEQLHLQYEQRRGYLVLYRSAREADAARPGLALLKELGVAHAWVDAAACRQLEPGLCDDTPLAGAIHLPQDGLGNCRQFAQLLRAEAQRAGVSFRFDTPVLALKAGPRPEVATAKGWAAFDAVVVCAGVEANALLRGIGLKLPLAPVHGYSITAPLRMLDGHPNLGPRAALMDERYKVAISRLGHRVRVAGSAEIGGRLDTLATSPLRTLYQVLQDWFPGAVLEREAQHWKGARPMLPDGPPVLGASGAAGVYLNLGHGSSGWALACGSALALAEQISGRPPPLDLSRLSLQRWQREPPHRSPPTGQA